MRKKGKRKVVLPSVCIPHHQAVYKRDGMVNLICLKNCMSRVWRAKDTWVSYLLGEAPTKRRGVEWFWKGLLPHRILEGGWSQPGDELSGSWGWWESYSWSGRGGISGVKGEKWESLSTERSPKISAEVLGFGAAVPRGPWCQNHSFRKVFIEFPAQC